MISAAIRLDLARLTPQQIADFALQADQDARRYRARGEHELAEFWQAEADRLADVIGRQ